MTHQLREELREAPRRKHAADQGEERRELDLQRSGRSQAEPVKVVVDGGGAEDVKPAATAVGVYEQREEQEQVAARRHC